jgi:hypothetical protein
MNRFFARRIAIVCSLLALLPDGAAAQDRETPPDRFQDFVNAAILSPTPYVLGTGGGLIDQVSNMPVEWSGGSGLTKRTVARLGSGFASDAIGHALAAVIRHRVRYDPCACRGFARVGHAMKRAFVSVTDAGGHAPNYSLWAAKFSAAGLANAWYPASYQRHDVLREGGVGIVVSGGLNILKEFTPELMRLNPFR